MTLYELLEGIDAVYALPNADVAGLTADSRRVRPGDVFVALSGGAADGHSFAAAAIDAGALAVVCARDLGLPRQILVLDTRGAYAALCANLMGNPQRRLILAGVTGTNGKTTVTHMLRAILRENGRETGLIGTNGIQIGEMSIPAKHTTPDPMALFATLRRMADLGCTHAVMEASSHGLDQNRVAGLHFAVAAFTNLTQDHLDYHGDMESYFAAKRRLFAHCDRAVVNADDPYGRRLAACLGDRASTYSVADDSATYTARATALSAAGAQFAFVGPGVIARVRIPMPGAFSVSNAMAAIGCAAALGLPPAEAARALERCPGVGGRCELLAEADGFTVLRDYAHTADGLEKMLLALRPFVRGRLITLFGCAGSRDRGKRPLMAAAVGRHSDFVFLTSDNPRHESERQIADDALPGLLESGTAHTVLLDRREAIHAALDMLREGDVLLLAGKGHEDYQVLDAATLWFDERAIVGAWLSGRGEGGRQA